MTLEGKRFPNWTRRLVDDLAFGNYERLEELARNYEKSLASVYKYSSNDLIKREVARLQAEVTDAHKSRLVGLLEDSYKAYEDLLTNADSDSVRLKAAEGIFKTFGVLTDKKEVKLSGTVSLPDTVFKNTIEDSE